MATKTQAGTIKVLWDDLTLDFPSAATLVSADLTGTITGAALGDPVNVVPLAGTATAGLAYVGYVSAADTVTVRQINASAGTLDTASAVYRVSVLKLNAYS
jgi:hypothetical protein